MKHGSPRLSDQKPIPLNAIQFQISASDLFKTVRRGRTSITLEMFVRAIRQGFSRRQSALDRNEL